MLMVSLEKQHQMGFGEIVGVYAWLGRFHHRVSTKFDCKTLTYLLGF